MTYIDSTALVVALPVIKLKLLASDAQAQWILEGYLLFLSSLILIGGALGDRYGRRRLFALGTCSFALSSIACALATSPDFLVAARCVQGIGAALMIPESLALITAEYSAKKRGRAIGIWASASAIAAAAGPLLGGWLTEHVSWRGVFWINVPLAIVVLAIAYLGVRESSAENMRGVPDILGSACVTAALGCIVFGLIDVQGSASSVSWLPLIIVGVLLLLIFVRIEHRAKEPVSPPRLFKSAAFSIASAYTFLLYAALGGALFFVPFELQVVMHYSPFDAGRALLPTILLIALGSPISGALAPRAGPREPLAVGAAIAALGFAWFSRLGVGASGNVLPATLLVGVGFALAVAPLTATVMGAAGPNDLGAASGINNAISRVGNLVAIAILGLIISLSDGSALPNADHPGFAHAMLAAAAMSAAAAMTAVFLPSRRRGMVLPLA